MIVYSHWDYMVGMLPNVCCPAAVVKWESQYHKLCSTLLIGRPMHLLAKTESRDDSEEKEINPVYKANYTVSFQQNSFVYFYNALGTSVKHTGLVNFIHWIEIFVQRKKRT